MKLETFLLAQTGNRSECSARLRRGKRKIASSVPAGKEYYLTTTIIPHET